MLLFTLFIACGDAEKPTPNEEKKEMVVETKEEPQNAEPVTTAPPSANSCEDQLKSYSEMVEEYIALTKKATAGDASAVQEYPNVLTKAQKSGQELQDLYKEGKIDADCWKQYNTITNKMNQAAMEMNNATKKDKQNKKENENAMDQASCLKKCQGLTDPTKMSSCMTKCM